MESLEVLGEERMLRAGTDSPSLAARPEEFGVNTACCAAGTPHLRPWWPSLLCAGMMPKTCFQLTVVSLQIPGADAPGWYGTHRWC